MVDSETDLGVDYEAQIATYDGINVSVKTESAWAVERLPDFARPFLNSVQASGGTLIADLCAGISIASIKMALERADLQFIAVEAGKDSVAIARQLIEQAGVSDRITVVEGNVLDLLKIEALRLLAGRMDVFERYGLTTHAKPKDRAEKYWPGVRWLIRSGGLFVVTAFSRRDVRFYDVFPSQHPTGEILFGPDHFKYPNIYQQFHHLTDLVKEIEDEGFSIVDALEAPHPRVPEERFVCEVIARYTGI